MDNMALYLVQRLSAMVMAPLVLIHLGVMIYAVQGGLDATEILARTRGSLLWALVYGLFVIAVSIHGAIGIRVIAHEWFKVSGAVLNWGTALIGAGLLFFGLRAVYAVVAS